MRLIDADALKNTHGMKDDCAECDKELRHKSRSCEFDRVYTLMDFCGWIDDAPTIESERKKGKWIHVRDEEDGNALYECSVCHKGEVHVPIVEVSYCWNCGADMRGEEHG